MNHQEFEKAQSYLRGLEALGFEVKPLWKELGVRTEGYATATPPPEDLKYSVPATAPLTADHFNGKNPVELAAHVMWMGYHYTLTPGQRRWFREFLGMTPSQTVTIGWLELWPGTQHLRAFKVSSDQHIDPRHRRHVIVDAVIREAGKFFEQSQAFDLEEAEPKAMRLTPNTLQLGYYYTLENTEKWAIQDLSDQQISNRVQVVHVGDTITFEDQTSGKGHGKRVTVNKDEFFETVAENEKLYNPTKKRKKSAESKQDFGDFMKDLEGLVDE